MSDKLKSMQEASITESNVIQSMDLYCASIGYPDLKVGIGRSSNASNYNSEQPELDESAFRDYVSKAEFNEPESFQSI